jgi:hypothetical protein
MAADAALQARTRIAHAAVHGLVALVLQQVHVVAAHEGRIGHALLAPDRTLDRRPGHAPGRFGRSRRGRGDARLRGRQAGHRKGEAAAECGPAHAAYSPSPIWM